MTADQVAVTLAVGAALAFLARRALRTVAALRAARRGRSAACTGCGCDAGQP